MLNFRQILNYTGWGVFCIAALVFCLTTESTVSLWDCGEFVACANKLQIMHPPGAPLFMLIGRLFTVIAELISENPTHIAYSLNILSGLSTAIAAMCTSWIAMRIGKRIMHDSEESISKFNQLIFVVIGLVAGLTMAFSSSVWFSAVEAEVYGLSTCFTMLIIWSAIKWYDLPDVKSYDRWLVFSFLLCGLSIGVHLLGLLTLPSIALLYYFKKHKTPSFLGVLISMILGLAILIFIQKAIIIGIPKLWAFFELITVNNLSLPIHSGLIPTVLIIFASTFLLLRLAKQKNLYPLHLLVVSLFLVVSAYSVYGIMIIRSSAEVSINTNKPNHVFNLIPYLNREQYGHKPLILGPHYKAKPVKSIYTDRFDFVDGEYKIVDKIPSNIFKGDDLLYFPRIGHASSSSDQRHDIWRTQLGYDLNKKPSQAYNVQYFWEYQLGWMYWRYFMWNFVGKQNKDQGHFAWSPKSGNWASGINFIDESRLHAMDFAPDVVSSDKGRNSYFFLPLFIGLIGMVFHFIKDKKTFLVLLVYFTLAGIGITIDSNLLPLQPRERHYVIIGSFIVFSIWVSLAVVAIKDFLERKKLLKPSYAVASTSLFCLFVPVLLLYQNWDDNDRSSHTAARDYAYNLLSSVEQDAILFVYGDNDKYPLLYLQEVEKIRRDVQVVNLSVLDHSTYINSHRTKINPASPLKFQLGEEDYIGSNKNFVYFNQKSDESYIPIKQVLSNLQKQELGYLNFGSLISNKLLLEFNNYVNHAIEQRGDIGKAHLLEVNLEAREYISKGELAMLDIIQSNLAERPIYYSATCPNRYLMGLNKHMSIEGVCLRLVPYEMGVLADFSPVAGSGKIDIDKTYNLFMNEWKWGGFEKPKQFVANGYSPIVNAMQLVILRLATNLTEIEDHKRAAAVCNKYFEVFPHENFPYDARLRALLTVLIRAKDYESAKKHIDILTKHSVQYINFYISLYPSEQVYFKEELNNAMVSIQEVYKLCEHVQDPLFEQHIKSQVIPYIRVEQ